MKTIKMYRVSQLSAVRKATRWSKAGQKWHFHLLSPACLFNTFGSHLLVIESSAGAFYSVSKQRHLHVGKQLFELLHGAKMFAYAPRHSQGKVSKILARARHLLKKKIPWHHHLLFPNCRFNQHKGKWVAMFEDPLNNKLTEVAYPHFPAKDLAEIEKLFYKQKK